MTAGPELRRRAVVVDRLPLVRSGITRVLDSIAVRTVAEASDLEAGIAAVGASGAGVLVVGEADRADARLLRRSLVRLDLRPAVVATVGRAERSDLIALLESGVDAVVLRSITPSELADTVRRILDGERLVSRPLLALLAGLPEASGPGAPADGAAPRAPFARSLPEPAGKGVGPALLTAKELQVLACLADGQSNQEIATALFLSVATVKTHLAHIYAKLGVAGRHAAVARGVSLGLLP